MNICEHLVNYFTEMCSLIFNLSEISIALRNGLVPICRQAISWSNDDKTYVAWRQSWIKLRASWRELYMFMS